MARIARKANEKEEQAGHKFVIGKDTLEKGARGTRCVLLLEKQRAAIYVYPDAIPRKAGSAGVTGVFRG